MLQSLLWLSTAVWVVVLTQILLNRLLCRNLETVAPATRRVWPAVSIVVPARNEEAGVGAAVESFCRQDYPDVEVIVVDDGSSDRTPAILAELAARHPNLRVVSADEPPPGWLGKPHALECGRRLAAGDWLLFVDADVVYAPDLLRRAISLALSDDAGMVVLGPRLITGSAVEAALMSSMYVVGLGLLPLYLVSRTRSPYIAFGAGTMNLVRRDAVTAAGAFSSIRDEVVDDVALGFRVKGAGHRIVVGAALDSIKVRMYRGVRDAVAGFAKNAYPGIARVGPWILAVPFVVGFVASFLPYLALAAGLAAGRVPIVAVAALVAMHAAMAAVALLFRQPAAIIPLNPVREALWWWILARSWWSYRRRGLVWRGRRYDAPDRR